MHVIIPVAGYGTRLRPHTYSKPKPLVQVAGNTVLGHIIDMLNVAGVSEITFIVGYLGEQVEKYMRDHYPDLKCNFVEQVDRKGQSHAIYLARDLVKEPMLIIFADTISDAKLSKLATIESDGVIFTKRVEDPRRFGVVTTDDNGIIQKFVEKPANFVSDQAVIGAYYVKDHNALFQAIERQINEEIITKGEYFLADALQLMVEAGKQLESWVVDVWEDCGTPEALLQTNRYMLEHGGAATLEHNGENCVIIPPVHIAPDVKISDSVIGPYVSLAKGCEIRAAIIRDTIVDEGTIIEDTMLKESLIGNDVVLKGRYRKLNVGDSSGIDFG